MDETTLFDLSAFTSPPDSPPNNLLLTALIPKDARVPIPSGTYASLAQLRTHCNQCHRCKLGDTRTHAVVDRGHVRAPVLIVGEAPGEVEDKRGKPFVGKSGQLLEKMLALAGLSKKDIYLTNVTKCRPPHNRTPTSSEIKACLPYLKEQVRLINPKIIVLLGATAFKALTGDKRSISKVRGTWIEWEGRLCMPIFHPAYLLRNPESDKGSPKWLTKQDIISVKKKLDSQLSN